MGTGSEQTSGYSAEQHPASGDEPLLYEPNPKHKEPWQRGARGSLCPKDADGPALLAASRVDPGLGTPFSAEAARYARRLAACQDRWPDPQAALAGLLARWDQGMVTGRRERRMAVRLAAEHAALVVPDAAGAEDPGPQLRAAGDAEGDDDDAEEIFDAPGGDFYADAFEILK